jgi:hypothetical protein
VFIYSHSARVITKRGFGVYKKRSDFEAYKLLSAEKAGGMPPLFSNAALSLRLFHPQTGTIGDEQIALIALVWKSKAYA